MKRSDDGGIARAQHEMLAVRRDLGVMVPDYPNPEEAECQQENLSSSTKLQRP